MDQTCTQCCDPTGQTSDQFSAPVCEILQPVNTCEMKATGIRGPQRPWIQCVENDLINDAVTRPLARPCHNRELPPVVIPISEYQRIQMQIGKRERKKAECQRELEARELEKLKSKERQASWNYTVESLIEKKRSQENAKKQMEIESTQALLEEVQSEREKQSKEQLARAKKLMLYRKGLIRDFHAAMANSKMLKDIEDSKVKSNCEEKHFQNRGPPIIDKICIKKMTWANNKEQQKEKKPCNPKLIELIKKDEQRVKERDLEIDNELCIAKGLRLECPYPLPESYKKYMAEPICDPNEKRNQQQKLRQEILAEIDNKLAIDAFIEAHENEIQRQAYEYNKYKRTVDRMKKEKEQKLIEDTVKRNIAASEKAAAVLVEMQAVNKKRADEYNQLREKWEAEIVEKQKEKVKCKEKLMELVYSDFEKRKDAERCKLEEMEPGRLWVHQRLVAVEDYEQECEKKNTKRLQAEELAAYHKTQMAEKKSKELEEKQNDDVWACRMKREYEDEMKEMKDYANECIKDWESKGRPIRPLLHSMKKWDYDAGMYPFPKIEIPNSNSANECQLNCAKYQTTGSHLGFDACGGT